MSHCSSGHDCWFSELDLVFGDIDVAFGHHSPVLHVADEEPGRPPKAARSTQSKCATSSSPVEHCIAERRRREKLGEMFRTLSAVVPRDRKKTDKASLLGDATKYVKQLQEKVKELEEKAACRTVESAVLNKREKPTSQHPVPADEYYRSSLPEMEARVSGRSLLLRTQWEKRAGMAVVLLAEIETLGLSVVGFSAVPFAGCTHEVTIVAQMEEGFSMEVKDVVRRLNARMHQFAEEAT